MVTPTKYAVGPPNHECRWLTDQQFDQQGGLLCLHSFHALVDHSFYLILVHRLPRNGTLYGPYTACRLAGGAAEDSAAAPSLAAFRSLLITKEA